MGGYGNLESALNLIKEWEKKKLKNKGCMNVIECVSLE